MLSKLKAEFNQKDLFSIWKSGNQKKVYAIEYVLNNPAKNFEALKAIVDYELENNKWDNVMKLMMSDNMRRAEDEYIKKYRERIITTIREKKRPMSMDEIDIEGVEELADSGIELSLSQPEGDTGSDMKHDLIKQAFPAVASFLEAEKGAEIDAVGLKAALREELRKLVEYDWRLAKLDKS